MIVLWRKSSLAIYSFFLLWCFKFSVMTIYSFYNRKVIKLYYFSNVEQKCNLVKLNSLLTSWILLLLLLTLSQIRIAETGFGEWAVPELGLFLGRICKQSCRNTKWRKANCSVAVSSRHDGKRAGHSVLPGLFPERALCSPCLTEWLMLQEWKDYRCLQQWSAFCPVLSVFSSCVSSSSKIQQRYWMDPKAGAVLSTRRREMQGSLCLFSELVPVCPGQCAIRFTSGIHPLK